MNTEADKIDNNAVFVSQLKAEESPERKEFQKHVVEESEIF